jgi:hypothetical protein
VFTRRGMLQCVGASAVVLSTGLKAQVRAVAVPLRLGNARLLVDAVIDGGAPVPVIIDTGAHVSIVAREFARARRLSSVGRLPASIGGRSGVYDLVQARKMVLAGGVDVGSVAFAVVEPTTLGDEAPASISGGIFTIMDSEFDFAANRLLIFPHRGPSRAGWTRHDKGVVSNGGGTRYIFAEAMAGTIPVRLALDTGAPTPLSLSEAVLRRAVPDWENLNWTTFHKEGSAVTRMFRLPVPFSVGGLRLERQLVRVRGGDGFFDKGLIGLPLMRQLDLATSVRDGALYTRPNGYISQWARYNMSGLWVDRRGSRLVAGAVGRGSPAEAAAIRVGDELGGLPFGPMIAALNGPAGSSVSFTAGGRPIALTLRDYL